MELPVRIVAEAPPEPVIAVDGAFGTRGLSLSHWPGHRTPAHLRHDLSSGSALAFGRLAPAERTQLAGGAVAIVNNHYDTDGALAAFATRYPALALPRAAAILAAARAGDFYQIPDFEALAIDAIVGGLSDPERSPLASELAGRPSLERWNVAQTHLLEHLPAILDGDTAPYRELWEPAVARSRADLARLEEARREEHPALELCVWRADGALAPGRHALFSSTARDRVLAVGRRGSGHTYRLVVSTLSWFDLVTPRTPRVMARPDLEGLARRLDALEGTREGGGPDGGWHAQPAGNASPELWFGRPELQPFAEHNDALVPSSLPPDLVLGELQRFS